MMTPRQIEPLRYVWACAQASFHNAHFSDNVPFLPEDFMTEGARDRRKAEALIAKQETLRAQRQIDAMQMGETAGVPKWALEVVN